MVPSNCHIKHYNPDGYKKYPLRILMTITICLYCGSIPLFGQDSQHTIESLARIKSDTVVLRWVPATIPVWQLGVRYGYVIERYTILQNDEIVPDGLTNAELLTPQPIKPASESVFEALSITIPEASIVHEAIYGNEFQMPDPNSGFTQFMQSYSELEARFGYSLFVCDLSPKIAEAAGLLFVDVNIHPNARYIYRIMLAHQPEDFEVEVAIAVVDTDRPDIIAAPYDLTAFPGNNNVVLSFPVMLHHGVFTAYIVERSTDNQTFLPLNDLPLVNAATDTPLDFFVYSDTLALNGQTYYYRVRGLTPFGELSQPSEAVESTPFPDFDAYAVIDTAIVIGENRIEIEWHVTETEAGQVKNIVVQRATTASGPYVDLTRLQATARRYTDTEATSNNYYRMMLEGEGDLLSFSFPYYMPLEDNEPPAPPRNITGMIDSAGIAMLAWQTNTEADILGYRVFRANAMHEEFVEVSPHIVADTVYYDNISLNSLSRNVFYRLVAVDLRYNYSDYSDPVSLLRPDTIPPAPAIFTEVNVNDAEVELTWEASPGDDIAGYALYLTTSDNTTTKIADWAASAQPGMYVAQPEANGFLTFTLETRDFVGNLSQHSRTCYIKPQDNLQIALSVTQARQLVTLNWQLPAGMQAKEITVYRAMADAPLTTYMQAESDELSFMDDEAEAENTYSYRLRMTFENGQTVFSEIVRIEIEK